MYDLFLGNITLMTSGAQILYYKTGLLILIRYFDSLLGKTLSFLPCIDIINSCFSYISFNP